MDSTLLMYRQLCGISLRTLVVSIRQHHAISANQCAGVDTSRSVRHNTAEKAGLRTANTLNATMHSNPQQAFQKGASTEKIDGQLYGCILHIISSR